METLRRLRTERGLSQARLAARAELDPSTVNQIERGAREASPATLHKLAAALDVGLYELLEGEPSPKEEEESPRDAQRRNFYEQIKELDSKTLEKLRDEEYAQYARLYAEWKQARAEDPTSARTAMLASQVDMAHGFALIVSLQLHIAETRGQVERKVEQELEALVGVRG